MSVFDVQARDNRYSGALYDASPEARVVQNRQQQLSAFYGVDIGVKDTLFASGGSNGLEATQQIGYEIGANKELGDDNLNFDHYVSSTKNQDDILFEGNDGILYNLNFTSGSVASQSTEEFAKDHGLVTENDKFYDIVEFGQDSAEFIDYEFVGNGDGQDKVAINVADEKWGNVQHVQQEVNASLFGSQGTTNEENTANVAYNVITSNASQWLKASDYETLGKITNRTQYMQTFFTMMINNLTQISNVVNEDKIEESKEEQEAEDDETEANAA